MKNLYLQKREYLNRSSRKSIGVTKKHLFSFLFYSKCRVKTNKRMEIVKNIKSYILDGKYNYVTNSIVIDKNLFFNEKLGFFHLKDKK